MTFWNIFHFSQTIGLALQGENLKNKAKKKKKKQKKNVKPYFLRKNKENTINLSSAELAQRVVKIKRTFILLSFIGLQEFSPVKPADVIANKFEGTRIDCQAPAAYPGKYINYAAIMFWIQ